MNKTELIQKMVCINCGMILDELKCKVKCTRCGYFEDCSDVGNDHPNTTHVETYRIEAH